MSDLIERLRNLDITRTFTGGQAPLITEAANEIERLEDDLAVALENYKTQREVHYKDRDRIERLEALLNDPARLREHIEAQIALEDKDE